MWYLQLFIVLVGLGVFQLGLYLGKLEVMPGSRLVDHAHFLILILLPFSWYTMPLMLFGIVAYVDDFQQHYRRAHGEPNYRSPLHLWGWYTAGEPLKNWLAKYVWRGFDDVG